jgi:hypothetical protein
MELVEVKLRGVRSLSRFNVLAIFEKPTPNRLLL